MHTSTHTNTRIFAHAQSATGSLKVGVLNKDSKPKPNIPHEANTDQQDTAKSSNRKDQDANTADANRNKSSHVKQMPNGPEVAKSSIRGDQGAASESKSMHMKQMSTAKETATSSIRKEQDATSMNANRHKDIGDVACVFVCVCVCVFVARR